MALFDNFRNENGEMSFLGHLDALRWHLFRSAMVIIGFAFTGFFFKDFLFNVVLFGPKQPTFPTFRFMCWLSHRLNMGDSLCVKNIDFKIINTDLSGQFTTHMMVAFIAGFILSLPYILWELWTFIKPALYEKERKYAKGIVFYTTSLFLIGILFGYYVIVPLSVNFLANYQVSESVGNFISLDSYIGTISTVTLVSGAIFELPMVIYFLSKIGLVTPTFMRKYRRHAVIVILIVSAIITPTSDATTLMLVSIPLYILYEISIFVSAFVVRNKQTDALKS
ncbi:MAG: twin-arginine translocase subunit TatC [Bacteroidota bacterium]